MPPPVPQNTTKKREKHTENAPVASCQLTAWLTRFSYATAFCLNQKKEQNESWIGL